jgi:HlyD family type I secretion membrane fusion protein
MKFDSKALLKRVEVQTGIEAPVIGVALDAPMSPIAKSQLRRPIVIGLITMAVFFVGFGIWATIAPIYGAVSAPGIVKVEANRKTLKSREGGVIREINVKEGDRVTPGTTLIKFNDSAIAAQVTILQNQYYTLLMQSARLQAETVNGPLVIPSELQALADQPAIASIINIETTVFNARNQAYQGQLSILRQRISQLNSTKSGLDIQIASINDQLGYMREELRGYRVVYEQGFASRAIVNRLQRQLSEVQSRQGELLAEVSRNRQQVGEAQLQAANLQQQLASEAATFRTEAETKLVDVTSRLQAARESQELTTIKSPVEGYVIGLSQFTIGGVAAPGETLMQVVPSNAPLIIEAQISPNDIDQVTVGLPTEVILSAYSTSKVPHLNAEVISVSPDSIINPDNSFTFKAQVRILPEELKKLANVKQPTPGMQATVMIKTGKRTFLSYLWQPIRENIDRSLREE